jgi:hypothetical protein
MRIGGFVAFLIGSKCPRLSQYLYQSASFAALGVLAVFSLTPPLRVQAIGGGTQTGSYGSIGCLRGFGGSWVDRSATADGRRSRQLLRRKNAGAVVRARKLDNICFGYPCFPHSRGLVGLLHSLSLGSPGNISSRQNVR